MTYKELVMSPRFAQLLLVGIAAGLQTYQTTGNVITSMVAAITIWLGSSVVVGTVDSAAKHLSKIGGNSIATTGDVSVPSASKMTVKKSK